MLEGEDGSGRMIQFFILHGLPQCAIRLMKSPDLPLGFALRRVGR